MTIRPTAFVWLNQDQCPTPEMNSYHLQFESELEEVTAYQFFDAESDLDAALLTSEVIQRRRTRMILGRHVLTDQFGNTILESRHGRHSC